MKKFLNAITIYSLILLSLTLLINEIIIYLDNSDKDHTDKYKHIPSSIQICNFGSSHGLYSFNYEKTTEITCFNFALESQSLSYDCRLLKNYLNRLNKTGTAYIVISYFSLFGRDETENDDFNSLNLRYYKILPRKYIKECDTKTLIYQRYFPATTKGADYLFSVLIGDEKNMTEIRRQRKMSPNAALEDAQLAYERHIVKNKFDSSHKRIYNQNEINSLYEIIAVCKNNGITPILVTTPYLKEYTQTISNNDKAFYDDFYALIRQITNNTHVQYYDYSVDTRFMHDYPSFMESDHLNEQGSKKFTSIILAETLQL